MLRQAESQTRDAAKRARATGHADIKAIAFEYSKEAIKILNCIAVSSFSDPARVAACNAILDRAHGKPAQSLDLIGSIGISHEEPLACLATGISK